MADTFRDPSAQASMAGVDRALSGVQAELERLLAEAKGASAELGAATDRAAAEGRARRGVVGTGGTPRTAPADVQAVDSAAAAEDRLAAAEARAAESALSSAKAEQGLTQALRERTAAAEQAARAVDQLARAQIAAATGQMELRAEQAQGALFAPGGSLGGGPPRPAAAAAADTGTYYYGPTRRPPLLLEPGPPVAPVAPPRQPQMPISARPETRQWIAGEQGVSWAGAGGWGGGPPPPPPTAAGSPFEGDGESEQSRANRLRAMQQAADDAAAAEGHMNESLRESVAVMGQSSDSLRRHGAMTTEFFQALARGEVPLSELNYQLGMTVMKVAGWTVATGAVFGLLGAIKEVTDGAKEASTAATNLQRFIPNLNRSQAIGQIGSVAQATDSPVKDVGDAAMQFARVQHDLPDVMAATRTAMLAMRLDNISTADSVKYFTAMMQELGLTGRQLPGVFDQIANAQREVGARSQELLPALAKSMGANRNTGGDYTQLAGLEAAAITLSGQSGSSVGTAFARGAANFYRRPQSARYERSLGLDPTQGFSQFVLSAVNRSKTLEPAQITQLSQAIFGPLRGGLLTSLFTHPEQVAAAQRAVDPRNATGSAAQEWQIARKSVSNELRQITVDLQAFGAALVRSGVFQPIGQLATAFTGLLSTTTSVVNWFGHLSPVLRDIAVYGGEAAAMFLLMRRLGVTGRASSALGGLLPGGADRIAARQDATAQVDYYTEREQAAARAVADANWRRAALIDAAARGEEVSEDQIAAASEAVDAALRRRAFAEDMAAEATQARSQLNRDLGMFSGMSTAEARAAAGLGARGSGGFTAGAVAGAGAARAAEEADTATSSWRAAVNESGLIGGTYTHAVERTVDGLPKLAAGARGAAGTLRKLATGWASAADGIAAMVSPMDLFLGALIALPIAIPAIEAAAQRGRQAMEAPTGAAQSQPQLLSSLHTALQQTRTNTDSPGEFFSDAGAGQRRQDTAHGTAASIASVLEAQKHGRLRFMADIETEAQGDYAALQAHQINQKQFQADLDRLRAEAQHSYESSPLPGNLAGADPTGQRVPAATKAARGSLLGGESFLKALEQQGAGQSGASLYTQMQALSEQQLLARAKSDTGRLGEYVSETGHLGTASLANLQAEYRVASDRAKANPTSGNLHTLATIEQDIDSGVVQPVMQQLTDALQLSTAPQQRAQAYQQALSSLAQLPGTLRKSRTARLARQGILQQQATEQTGNYDAYTQFLVSSQRDDPVAAAQAQQQRDEQQLPRMRELYHQGLLTYDQYWQYMAKIQDDRTKTAQAVLQDFQQQQSVTDAQYALAVGGNQGDILARAVSDAQTFLARTESTPGATAKDIAQAQKGVAQALLSNLQYQQQQASDMLDAQNALAQAGVDPANKVALDNLSIRLAQQHYAQDRGNGGKTPADRVKDQATIRDRIAQRQRDIAQTRFDDIQFYASIGQISAQTEIEQLDQLLGTIKNNKALKRQIQSQLYSLRNSAATSGVDINIGNIKLPTVYEVRRAIAGATGHGQSKGISVSNVNRITMHVNNGADVHDVFATVDRITGSSLTAAARSAGVA